MEYIFRYRKLIWRNASWCKFVFYFSGIFYSVSTRIPAPYGPIFAKINPAAFLIEQSRNVLLRCSHISIEWYVIWLVIGIGLSVIGVRLVYKNENDYVYCKRIR